VRKPKIIILIVLLAVVIVSPATAQSPLEKISKGFRAGFAVGSAVDYDGKSDTRTGNFFGLLLNYRENRLLSVQLEAIYISKGYKTIDALVTFDDGTVSRGNFEVIFNYIEVPLTVKVSGPLAEKYHPYLIGGGFVSYLTDSKLRLSEGIPFDFDLDNAEDVDYGIVGGGGMDIKIGNGYFFFETRYDLGLAEVIQNKSQKLRLVSFHLGYAW